MGLWNLSGLWRVLEIRGRRSDGMSLCYAPNLKPSQLEGNDDTLASSIVRLVFLSTRLPPSVTCLPRLLTSLLIVLLTMQEPNSTVSKLSSPPTNQLPSLGPKSKPTPTATY